MGGGHAVVALGRRHRRVDDAEDVAGARQHEALVGGDVVQGVEGLRPGRDVVVLRGDGVERLADAAQVDRFIRHDEGVGLDEAVVQVELAQIPRVHRKGHARGVHVPVQHVEGRGRLAVQPAVHHVVPDQAVRAQQTEGCGHVLAVQVAFFIHLRAQVGDALLVDEDLDVARLVEVHQGGEQRPVAHRHGVLAVVARRPGHPGGERGAADAVADRVHPLGSADLACHPHDLRDALRQVVVEADLAHRRVGVLPARDVDVQALVEQEAHHALPRVEVEDVELVDPGRDDHHRLGMHLRPGGCVVDDLEQAVAEDHRARRGGEVLADAEAVGVGHAHVARLQVGEHVLPALPQAVAAGVDELAQRDRVGPQVVGRRHRVEPLPPPERRAPALLAGQPRRLVEHVLDVVGEGEVPLLHQVPGGRIGPHRVGEAGIVGVRLDRVHAGKAERAPPGVPLQLPQVGAEAGEALAEFLRVHEPGHLCVQDGRGDAEGVGAGGEAVADRGDVAVNRASIGNAVLAVQAAIAAIRAFRPARGAIRVGLLVGGGGRCRPFAAPSRSWHEDCLRAHPVRMGSLPYPDDCALVVEQSVRRSLDSRIAVS